MSAILSFIADCFEHCVSSVLSGVVRVRKEFSDSGFFIEITASGTIPQEKAEALLSSVKERVSGGEPAVFPDGIVIKNVSGVHSEDTDGVISRIDVLYFPTEEALVVWREEQAAATERDHRRIGQELGLWTFSPLVGSGLPLFTPRGTAIRNALFGELTALSRRFGAQPVSIPHIAKRDLYDVSGHSEKFGDELLRVISHYDEFVMKPVNCPHHTQIYASEIRSYRDLPIRYIESTMQYRDEKPGEIGGLTRVRAITVDDGHTFCTVDQIQEEVVHLSEIIREFYSHLGLWGNHWVSLSVRSSGNLDGYIGENDDWDRAEEMLRAVSDDLHLDAKRCEGEAAIYGPKLDFIFRDSLGREHQLATVQLDFAMPKRFGLYYIDASGGKRTPVMIHRAVLGSYERFLAVLLEHFAGWLPCWLSPVQVGVIPVGKRFVPFADGLRSSCEAAGVLTEFFTGDETLGKRIQKAKGLRVPFIIVVGEKEESSGVFSLQFNQSGEIAMTGSSEEVIVAVLAHISGKTC